MTGIHDLGLFIPAGLLLNVTPGPDMAYIAARSASGGFRSGVAATLGITAGCVVHTLAAAAGLSVILATSAAAFTVVALGSLFNFNSLFVNLPVAWLSAHAGRRIRTHVEAARWLTGAVGALFVLLAARLATLERN